MSGKRFILIVDTNVAFATLLKESVEQEGEYRAIVATGGREAVQALSEAEFDLAIVDLGLADPDGITLARALRQRDPALRLMLIPLDGAELPPESNDLDVQGVLTKPFFFPELPGRIADALARPVAGIAVASHVDGPGDVGTGVMDTASGRSVEECDSTTDIVQEMTALAQEINAEAVILANGGRLVADTGRLSAETATRLARAVAESWHTPARATPILGQERLRFKQGKEGDRHLLYSLVVAEDVILSVALRANDPLGMVRHRIKATADSLRRLIGKG
ncbi:MAG: response regulator [Chloroflexi bacterium]|nr:response regulator [Chloroflexota bacterium]